MEYLVIDTGKLYHHKMRLDSVLRKNNVSRDDVLSYVKNKHHLYFVSPKLKDSMILKFIDKILSRKGIAKAVEETPKVQSEQSIHSKGNAEDADDDFDYLNDEEEEEYYDEDYEDYEDPSNQQPPQEPSQSPSKPKNAFLAYSQPQEEEEEEEEAQANWDLDLDENDDFVWAKPK